MLQLKLPQESSQKLGGLITHSYPQLLTPSQQVLDRGHTSMLKLKVDSIHRDDGADARILIDKDGPARRARAN